MSTETQSGNESRTDIAKTKRVFPHSASVGDITLQDEMGGEHSDLEGADSVAVLGYEVISTTGDFYIERDWLLTVMDMVGLPEWMAPAETQPHRAFGRAMNELLEDGRDRYEPDDYVTITFRLESAGRYTKNLLANLHVSEEFSDVEGGQNRQFEIGVISYDSESSKPRFYDKIDPKKDSQIQQRLADDWEDFQMRYAELWDKHMNGHIGKDINTMFNQYFINQWTDSVQLRPAVYFVPATQQLPDYWSDDGSAKTMRDIIGYDAGENDRQGFAGLYAYINDYKERSAKTEDTEIIRLPVYDNADQREMVRRKVQAEMEDAVSGAFDTILQKMSEDDTVASEVAAAISDRFNQMGDTASTYKSIIQTELAVEEVMRSTLEEMGDDDSEMVRKVMAELDVFDDED